MNSSLARRLGLPALFLSGAMVGSAITGMAVASQPHMQSALSHLGTARAQLMVAEADKNGHRDKALALVNQAINEVKMGIMYAAHTR